jgi:methanogenic corrinoid protein MtbC1
MVEMESHASQVASVRFAVTTALIEGDPGGAFHLVRALLDQGLPFDVVLFDVVAAAHADFGNRWKEGDYRISDEHAASGAVETLVAMLAGSFDLPEGGERIVVAAAEGDHHSLPTRFASAYLLSLGYHVQYLGANMEANDLASHLLDESPRALILSCAMSMLLPGARASVRAAHRAGVPVLAGGLGYGRDGAWAYAIGADAWVASPREIQDVLTTWEPDIEVAEMVVPVPPADLQAIEEHREQVLASAIARLTDPPRRLRSELGWLLDAAVAALLVDDPELLAEFSEWQAAVLTSHGFHETTAGELRRALSTSLESMAPTAARLLA